MTAKSITSLQHPLVKHLVKLRQQRSYRKDCQHLIIEGKKILHDIHPLIKIKHLLFTDASLLPATISCEEKYQVTDAIIEKITGSVTPEGIVAEVAMPEYPPLTDFQSMVVLDRIQDPGNLGTIIRTALAFGWEAIYCIEGTCDIWNDKVIRATRGAAFQIPFYHGSWSQLLKVVKNNHAHVFAADLGGQTIETLSLPEGPIALVLGNEGQGVSEEASTNCQKLTIPISNQMESLNVAVAGGILMYHLRGHHHG